MSIAGAAVFGIAGNAEGGAEVLGGIIDAGTLGGGSGLSFAFAGQVYTVMVDGGGLSVVVVVCAGAVEVVMYVRMMVGKSEVVFCAAFGVSGARRTLEGVDCDWEVVRTAGALGI